MVINPDEVRLRRYFVVIGHLCTVIDIKVAQLQYNHSHDNMRLTINVTDMSGFPALDRMTYEISAYPLGFRWGRNRGSLDRSVSCDTESR